MENKTKFVLPSPNFASNSKEPAKSKMHYLTPSGMTLLPREKQPPPMWGPRGTTVPPKYLAQNVKKDDTAPMPTKQFCEPCEMEFQSAEDLRRHRAQHERCPVDGCNYRGHSSVMDKHVTVLHSSGLFDKFKKLSTPEEIAAWREERRKKYPSMANVQMRQAAKEQRQKRGERLEANQSRFGRRDDRRRVQKGESTESGFSQEQPDRRIGKAEKRLNKRRKTHEKRLQRQVKVDTVKGSKQETNVDVCAEVVQCGGVAMFGGTGKLKNYKRAKPKKTVQINALAGLIGMYGGSDEDDVDEQDHDETEDGEEEEENETEALKINASKPMAENNLDIKETTEQVQLNKPPENQIMDDEEEHGIKSTGGQNSSEIIEENDRPISTATEPLSDEAPEEAPIAHTSDFAVAPKRYAVTESSSLQAPPSKRSKNAELPSTSMGRSRRQSGLDYRKARLRKQNTMLEKLLESDIRHERNVLLQCVRFVCENEYFGIGKGKTSEEK